MIAIPSMASSTNCNEQRTYTPEAAYIKTIPTQAEPQIFTLSQKTGAPVVIFISSPSTSIDNNKTQYRIEEATLLKESPWVTEFMEKSKSLNSVDAVVPYYKKIDELARNKKFNVCDIFLSQVNTAEVSDVLLVGLLRLTYPYKQKLSSWQSLLAKSEAELSKRGHDSSLELTGLI